MRSVVDLKTVSSAGRVLGLLILVQILVAVPVYTQYGMIQPVTSSSFLTEAAPHEAKVRLAVLLVFFLGSLTLAMALAALPVFRRYSERMAFLYLALAVLGLGTQVVESVTIRNMLALSTLYITAGTPAEVVEVLGRAARSTWLGAHFTNLLVGHLTVLVLYLILYRFALVPRVLAGLGILATGLSTTAATLPLLGGVFRYWMVAPAAVTTLALALWLVFRGFSGGVEPVSGSAAGELAVGRR